MDKNFFKKTRILDGGMGQELLNRGVKPYGTIWGASALLKKAAKIASGSGEPHKEKVATITKSQVMDIVKIKKPDLNTEDDEAAARIIAGSARQMGIEIEGM